jgi:hypothetical protein
MATSAEHRATAEQLLAEARQSRAEHRSREASADLRDEAATHSRLAIAAALEALQPPAAKTA